MLFPRIKFGFHGSSFTKGILFINSNCGVVAQREGNLNVWQSYTQRFHLAITCDLAEREQTTSQGECLQLVEFLSHSFFLVNNRFMISLYSSWLEGNHGQLYFTDRVECLNWGRSSFITREASKIYWSSVVSIFFCCVSLRC